MTMRSTKGARRPRPREQGCVYMVRCVAGLMVLLTLAMMAQAQAQARPALAQAAPAPPAAAYEETLARAFQDFEQGHFVEAGTLFREAHRRFPNAHTLRALGMVEHELEHYVSAVDFLERALASQVQPLSAELRASATQLLTQARGHVALVRVQFTPPQAVLLVDGLVAAAGSGDVLSLNAGEHELALEARGHTSARRMLHAIGGEPLQELELALVPLPTTPRRAERRPLHNWWLWTAVVVVVAGSLTAGLVIGLGGPERSPVQTGSTGIHIEVPSAGSASR
jgi:hypothetical protein